MQVVSSHSLRCRGTAQGRSLSDSEQRLTGTRRVHELYAQRRHHTRQRLDRFIVSSYQETSPSRQDRSTLPPPSSKGSEQYNGSQGISKGTTILTQSRESPLTKPSQRSSNSTELANNIAPVTVRTGAPWRKLGRSSQTPSVYKVSIQTATEEAANQAVVRSSPVKLTVQLPRKVKELSPAVAEGALAPFPSLLRSWEGLHKPVGLVLASAHVLFTACALTGVEVGPAWLPAAAGGLLGGMYAVLNRVGMRRLWKAPTAPLSVIITGGTKGIGKALAREFLRAGDSVVVTSRTTAGARLAAATLREEVGSGVTVHGVACDVSSPGSVARLGSVAGRILGRVDVWINNAGYSGSFQYLVDATPEQLAEVVQTNLLGSLLCTRTACRLMELQETGGHVFNMDGAGADGQPTPQYVAYGATKAAIAHLMGSLQAELSARDSPVMIHTLSPGMVLTDLLLDGATDANKQIFNILCEHPETVAAYMVPRLRTVVARGYTGSYIRYLTIPRALMRFITAPLNSNRYFDSAGNRLYGDEIERISGQRQRRTERLAVRAARRSRTLGLAYSLSMAASLLIFVTAAGNVAGS